MQKIVITSLQFLFRMLESFVPVLSNRLALWLFFRPAQVARPKRELPILKAAKRERRQLEGYYRRPTHLQYYEAYEWGEGPPVLLVHGWGGRGTQFHGLVGALVGTGYKAVSFDAPAHGDSPGSRTNLLEFGEILRDLSAQHGEFRGIVAHSFGAVASVRGLVLDGIPAGGLTTLGAPANLEVLFEGFTRQLRVTERSLRSIKSFLNELAVEDMEEFSLLTHLPAMDRPLLVFHDTDDTSVEVAQGQRIAQARPDAEWVQTTGLGHNRILSDQGVIARILEFLDKGARRASGD